MFGELGSPLSMARETEARLTLSQIRAVALPSRMDILRTLADKRATVSEVAKRTKLPKSTAYKHLRVLERHALVRRNDDKRLWKYYDLTRTGRIVAKLDPLRILVIPCLALGAALVAGAVALWRWGLKSHATDPWGVPPIGGEPVEPVARDGAVGLAAAGLALLGFAAWAWLRARARGRRSARATGTRSSR